MEFYILNMILRVQIGRGGKFLQDGDIFRFLKSNIVSLVAKYGALKVLIFGLGKYYSLNVHTEVIGNYIRNLGKLHFTSSKSERKYSQCKGTFLKNMLYIVRKPKSNPFQ